MKISKIRGIGVALILAAMFLVGVKLHAIPAAGGSAQVIVTVEGPKGAVPELRTGDVVMYQRHDRLPVTSLTPLAGTPLELYVAIDDSVGPEFSDHLNDLTDFINAQPATTAVGVAYLHNGTVEIRQKPTTDHAAAAKAVRLPLPNMGSSPFESLVELLKEWPVSNVRHEVVMISNGIEPFGVQDMSNQLVQSAVDAAQRAEVPVFAIYAPPIGHWGHTFWRTTWGEAYLSRLADESGGEGYNMTGQTVVTLAPYFQEITQRLQHQYRVAFTPKAPAHPGFVPIRATTEVPHANLVTQDRVWVGGE